MEFKEIESKIENFGKDHPTYWGCAIAGEVGELANLLKKWERDGPHTDLWRNISEELADVFIYAVLIAREFDINFENAIISKIDGIKKRRLIEV